MSEAQVNLDLVVITTANGRFVVLGERDIGGKECLALISEGSFQGAMDKLAQGEDPAAGPEVRWVEKRLAELVPVPHEEAEAATRQLTVELVGWAKPADA